MAERPDFDDDLLWSPDTCKLSQIIEDIPTLVRVTEGIYSCNDAGTFSQGDIIKIDACKPMTRVCAYLTRPGSNIRYEKFDNEISLPYHYNGRVQVMPMHGEYFKYTSVEQLIEYFPRYVRVLGRINFTETSGKAQTLQSGDHLELKAVRRNKANIATSLRCSLDGEDIVLPKSLTGVFQVLPDEKEQTIRDVVESYKLPQCVRFLGSGIQEIMSKDIQEAIDNLTSYSGEMILTGKKESAPVLFGHYKGMDADPSSRFCRRSAVVIPLDTPDISEIEVQLPTYMDSDDYELFLLKNFSQSSTTPAVLEGALYVEFAKTSKIQFLPDISTPAVPPRIKTVRGTTGNSPPPVPGQRTIGKSPQSPPGQGTMGGSLPPVPGQGTTRKSPQSAPGQGTVGKFQLMPEQDTMVKSTPPAPKPQKGVPEKGGSKKALVPPVRPAPYQRVMPIAQPLPTVSPPTPPSGEVMGGGLDLTISDVFAGGWPSEDQATYEVTEELPPGLELPTAEKKKHILPGVLRDFAKKVSALKVVPERKRDVSPMGGGESDADDVEKGKDDKEVYDYIDDVAFFEAARKAKEEEMKTGRSVGSVKPVQRVMPNTCKDVTPDKDTSKELKDLTISELEAVLIDCGMSDLARICKNESVDGNWFTSLTTPILKKKPFNLSDFHITKVDQIRGGWRPKT